MNKIIQTTRSLINLIFTNYFDKWNLIKLCWPSYYKIIGNDNAYYYTLFFIFSCYLFANAQSQRTVKINLYSSCILNDPARNNLNDFQVHYYLDGQETSPWGSSYPIGTHNLRVVLSPNDRMNGKVNGTYTIAEISLVDDLSRQEQNFTPNKIDATVSLNINPVSNDKDVSTLNVRIERCQGSEGKKTHVKIITRQSCLDDPNENVTIQENITVSIGGKTLVSDLHGVIETDLTPGNYQVSAMWKDYSFGFLNQNGLRLKNKENGLPTVNIGDKEETLEVRMFTCETNGQAKARAVITEIGDKILLTRKNKQIQIYEGMQLRDGDFVKIFGTAKIKWLDGNAIINFENPSGASFRVGYDNAPVGGKGLQGPSGIQILKGIGSFLFPKGEPEAEGRFLPSTNSIVCGPKGTIFSLAYDDETDVSTVIVTEGIVTCYPKNPSLKPFDLYPGQQVKVSMNEVSPITSATNDGNIDKNTNKNSTEPPSWSRGEQLLQINFEEAIGRAKDALIAEGYVNLFKQANFIAGYKGQNTAVIMCNDAPGGKQWINIVVTSITDDSGIPGREREKLQAQMNVISVYNKTQEVNKNIDWYKSAEEYRGKYGERYTFTCPVNDYPGHRLYGTDIYTDDSSICLAGVHSGVISFSGGKVTIEIQGAKDSFQGSTHNGAVSSSYGGWPGSFSIVK